MDYGNGDFYVGQWKDGKRHGRGMFFSSTEGTYDGEFLGDIKEGFGNMQHKNGDFYSGHWKKGLYHGHGVLNCVTGGMVSYDGTWENGVRHGKGTIYFRNGSKYEGHLKENVVSFSLLLIRSFKFLTRGGNQTDPWKRSFHK